MLTAGARPADAEALPRRALPQRRSVRMEPRTPHPV